MIHYRDEFESTEQIIDVDFAMVYVILQQEALLRIIELFTKISTSFQYVSYQFTCELITVCFFNMKEQVSVFAIMKQFDFDAKQLQIRFWIIKGHIAGIPFHSKN